MEMSSASRKPWCVIHILDMFVLAKNGAAPPPPEGQLKLLFLVGTVLITTTVVVEQLPRLKVHPLPTLEIECTKTSLT
jgi:hypothetical protein